MLGLVFYRLRIYKTSVVYGGMWRRNGGRGEKQIRCGVFIWHRKWAMAAAWQRRLGTSDCRSAACFSAQHFFFLRGVSFAAAAAAARAVHCENAYALCCSILLNMVAVGLHACCLNGSHLDISPRRARNVATQALRWNGAAVAMNYCFMWQQTHLSSDARSAAATAHQHA